MVLFFLSLWIISLSEDNIPLFQKENSTITPTEAFTIQNTFPEGLACSYIEPGPGPTWGKIEIGRSTLEEFTEAYSGEYQISVGTVEDMLYVTLEAKNVNLPRFSYPMCVLDGVIYAIRGWPPPPSPYQTITVTSEPSTPMSIYDYAETYGIPDVVTYTFSPSNRVAFWFEKGIAIVVIALKEEEQTIFFGFGMVVDEIFFPYQKTAGYETRWPFNRTRTQWIYTSDPHIPSAQDPFGFHETHPVSTALPIITPSPIWATTLTSTPTNK